MKGGQPETLVPTTLSRKPKTMSCFHTNRYSTIDMKSMNWPNQKRYVPGHVSAIELQRGTTNMCTQFYIQCGVGGPYGAFRQD